MESSGRPLKAFIGLNDHEEVRLYVTSFTIHPVSPMHLRGRPFPSIVYDIQNGQGGDPIAALELLTQYYQRKTP